LFNFAAIAIGLLTAGFIYGQQKKPSIPGKKSYLNWIILTIVGAPFVILLMAKLFSSNVLGWLFGLSLIIVWPLVLVATIGVIVGLRFNRNTKNATVPQVAVEHNSVRAADATKSRGEYICNPATTHLAGASLLIRIDRDSVHTGDDTEPHSEDISVPSTMSIAALLEKIQSESFLPSIIGGEATWLIESAGHPPKTIGVLAQQWHEPQLTIDPAISVAHHFKGSQPMLFFRYCCQIDPQLTLSQLRQQAANSSASPIESPAFPGD
jgi:hypothetical protein